MWGLRLEDPCLQMGDLSTIASGLRKASRNKGHPIRGLACGWSWPHHQEDYAMLITIIIMDKTIHLHMPSGWTF